MARSSASASTAKVGKVVPYLAGLVVEVIRCLKASSDFGAEKLEMTSVPSKDGIGARLQGA